MADALVASPQAASNSTSAPPAAGGSQRTPSPPPNCAICLGVCINKCFSDSCMHQFCFRCLQEWSKVKAVCPLCKQPFTSIIHNVRANNEYDQYYILERDAGENPMDEIFLPRVIPGDNATNTSRHFQFRTTLTVDPRGELAIQQLLSTHFNSMNIMMPIPSHYMRTRRTSRQDATTNYRRSLYDRNVWTRPLVDVTGRYRETSPTFYRENPATTNRLVPFLRRELYALIPGDAMRVAHLTQRILLAVTTHPIRSVYMRHLLEADLGVHTTHFIHELYTFARSPFDIYGYDRHSEVQGQPPDDYDHESDGDSDVLFVSVERVPPRAPVVSPEVIEIGSESSDNSDVVIREPTPPVLVDLADTTDSDNNDTIVTQSTPSLPATPKTQKSSRSKPSRRNATSKRKRRVWHTSSSSSSDEAMSSTTCTVEDTFSSSPSAAPHPSIASRCAALPTRSSDCATSESSLQESVKEKRKRLRTRKQRSRSLAYSITKKRLKIERNDTKKPLDTRIESEDSPLSDDEYRPKKEKKTFEEGAPWSSTHITYSQIFRGIDEPGPSNSLMPLNAKEQAVCTQYSDSD